jgi:hypothetical protein
MNFTKSLRLFGALIWTEALYKKLHLKRVALVGVVSLDSINFHPTLKSKPNWAIIKGD